MINALLSGVIEFISSVAAVFTAPINALIVNAFPDLSNYLVVITNVLNQITGVIAYFLSLIPPFTRSVILMIFTFWITIWPLRIAVWNISFGLNFIKRVNIFSSK